MVHINERNKRSFYFLNIKIKSIILTYVLYERISYIFEFIHDLSRIYKECCKHVRKSLFLIKVDSTYDQIKKYKNHVQGKSTQASVLFS